MLRDREKSVPWVQTKTKTKKKNMKIWNNWRIQLTDHYMSLVALALCSAPFVVMELPTTAPDKLLLEPGFWNVIRWLWLWLWLWLMLMLFWLMWLLRTWAAAKWTWEDELGRDEVVAWSLAFRAIVDMVTWDIFDWLKWIACKSFELLLLALLVRVVFMWLLAEIWLLCCCWSCDWFDWW